MIRAKNLDSPTLPDRGDSGYAQRFAVSIAAARNEHLVRSQYAAPDPLGPTYGAEVPWQ
ncbi:MAG: hypothetical protein ABIR59_05960 [Gemmatimonadales bacterium]